MVDGASLPGPAPSRPVGARSAEPSLQRPFLRVAIPAVVAVLAFAVLTPALEGDFVNLDDRVNFVDNQAYRGVGPAQLAWMWTHFDGHYQPVTWLSHGIEYRLFGLDPRAFHTTNLLLHAANAVLAYLLFLGLLGRAPALAAARGGDRMRLAAGVGALLFALHPLRVESVAWITERRAVLFLFFALLSLIFYLRSNAAGVGTARRRAAIAISTGCFALSMLSNALCMTLPVLLLVLDAYPLRRLRGLADVAPMVIEKWPWFAVTIAGIGAQLFAQSAGDAIDPESTYGMADMLTQPGYRLAFYVWKTVWPTGLYPMYTLPLVRDPWSTPYLLCGFGVLLVTLVLVASARRAPALLAGWVAFGLLLSPVLGLVQVGYHFASDRNTYLAGLVPALLIAGGLAWLWTRGRAVVPSALIAGLLIATYGAMSFEQSKIWLSSLTMWRHAVEYDPDNYVAHYGLGHELQSLGEVDLAIDHYTRAIFARDDDARFWYNRGVTFASKRALRRAILDFDQAIAIDPEHWMAYNNRGVARMMQSEYALAIDDFTRALDINPRQRSLYAARARAYEQLGDFASAERDRARSRATGP